MFLVDDLLLGPGKGALLVFKELARKAQEDWLDDDSIKQELQEIYALAEAGKISTQDFEARECRLLERLEQIARMRFAEKWTNADASEVIEGEISAAPLPPLTTGASPAPRPEPPASDAETMPMRLALDDYGSGPLPIETPAAIAAPVFAPSPPPPPVFEPPPSPLPVFAPVLPSAAAPRAPHAPSAPQAPSRVLSISEVVESTKRALALLNLKVSVISSISPDDGGWRVTAELVERRGIPDTNDLIGVYELRLDPAGSVLRYERTRLRRRADLGQ